MGKRFVALAISLLSVGATLLVPLLEQPASGALASVTAERRPGYAPLARSGPRLSVPRAKLAAAVTCSGNFHANDLEPVLFNPATGVTARQNFSWNYQNAFTAQHRPWCAVTPPHHTLGDIQISAEYIVYALRHTHALAGRKIAILGHSQGGMSMRWALRFWPDTRPMVADVISMAPDHHGTTLVDNVCTVGRTTCVAGLWQQASKAHFIEALNSRAETFAGISYTSIYSKTDEVVMPTRGPRPTSALFTGMGRITNVTTQSVCPLDLFEHLLIGTVDPVAYALVMDALRHRGPADPDRIDSGVCGQLYMPGVDPADVADNLSLVAGLPYVLLVPVPDVSITGLPQLKEEPPLRCYVYADGCSD
ncbi:lipase [Nocardioides humilatus]|uniref:Lipase n=1 Tax=Nocardioides humilatus TaxID=2607660 RepID=A0A5B1L7A2_9ACTN|nr:lipase [Nocardioides humilatus]KAA1416415.1 lipase [Nocardioides humilatus]